MKSGVNQGCSWSGIKQGCSWSGSGVWLEGGDEERKARPGREGARQDIKLDVT